MSLPVNEDPSIRLRFSSAAKSYRANAVVQHQVVEDFIALMPASHLDRQQSILEIGCGTGALTQRLIERFPGASLTAIDLSPDMIEQARTSIAESDQVRLQAVDVMEFQTDQRYDVVASSSALHWVTPLSEAIAAVDRLVDAGGTVVLAIMLQNTLKELHQSRLQVAPKKTPASRLPTFEEFSGLAKSTGWKVQTCVIKSYVSEHASARQLLVSLHQQGLTGGPVSRSQVPLNRSELAALVEDYDRHNRTDRDSVQATFEVGFLRAVKPE
jgi:malonyl-CoA O-methyltransferase